MQPISIGSRSRLGMGLTIVLASALLSAHAWAQADADPPADPPPDSATPATPPDASNSTAGASASDGNPASSDKPGAPAPTGTEPGATGTNASGANATGANATGANATGANATGANATGANANGTGSAVDEPDTGNMPVNLRLRRLEQRVQALKERAWRAKARVGMLKEAVLGGGVGATATVIHKNKMGSSYRLVKLVYALDGTQVFARADDTGALHKKKNFEVLTGPIAPGSHTISVLALYRGHGYGVFKYLTKYKFTVRSSHTFTATEGKNTRIEAVGFERGGVTTPLEDRPAIDFKVSHDKGPGGS